MARFLEPALLEELHQRQEARAATRVDAEAAVLGIDHAELGGLIARSWALPDTLVRGIREHGRPRPESDALVHAVYLADVLAKAAGAGIDDNRAIRVGVRPGDGGARPDPDRLRRAEAAGRAASRPRSNAASTERARAVSARSTLSGAH